MRGRVIASIAGLVLVVGAGCDSAENEAVKPARDSCFDPTFRLRYWPNGDPSATPESPERTDPHLVIYRGSTETFQARDRLLYVSAREFSGPCAGPRRPASGDTQQMADKQTVFSRPITLTCTADRVEAFDDLDVEPGFVQVRATPRKLLYAAFTPHHFNPSGPMIKYNGKACTRT